MPAPVLRQLTGVTPDQFARLVIELGPRWEAARTARLTTERKAPRQRVLGAGRKPLAFSARLFAALVQLRWNLPYRTTGALLGISKDMVQRSEVELLPLLAEYGITAPDGTRIGDAETLTGVLAKLTDEHRAVLLDGSYVPTNRPGGGWEAQKSEYSTHRHRHCRTFQAISTDQGELLWVGAVEPGSTHDLTAIAGAETEVVIPLRTSKIPLIADKGYIGIKARLKLDADVFTPRRRKKDDTRGEAVRNAEKEFNTAIARRRVRVEHAFSDMKEFKTLHRSRRHSDHLGLTVRAIAALVTMPA